MGKLKIYLLFVLAGLSEQGLHAAPVSVAGNVQVKVSFVKPLTLTGLQNFDLGTIILSGAGTWTGATVRLSQAGALTCSANLICSGASQVAKYQVSGSNKQTVSILAPPVTLRNAINGSTLMLSLDAPQSLVLTNSGNSGAEFSVGGLLTINSSTADGVYSGALAVTVDYN